MKENLKRLELYAGKLARTVLRGVVTGNSYYLLDTDNKTKEVIKKTTWHNVIVYRDCSEYKKGERVSIEGKINIRDWQDKEGKKRQSFEIVVGSFDGQISKVELKPEDIHQVYDESQMVENTSELPF